MKITLVIASLQSGGAERVMSTLANAWAARGEEVSLLTFQQQDEISHYEIDGRVKIVKMALLWPSKNIITSLSSNLRRHNILRKTIRAQKPDAVISFCDTTNIRVILALIGLKIPVLVSERVDPSKYLIPSSWSLLRRLTYPLADRIVVQTERIRSFFRGRALRRCIVIPNPVLSISNRDNRRQTREITSDKQRLLAVGRLDHQKGFDLLIESYSQVAEEFSNWDLHIFGDGPERGNLERIIAQKSLQNRVFLRGITKDVYSQYLTSDLFVLSSRFEGIPNALCEAMACGMPAISFDCPTGPREIIDHNVNGILLPPEDVAALTQSLRVLMESTSERERLGKAAIELSNRFKLENILKLWDKAIAESIANRLGANKSV